jgi:hypothetical protein
LPFAPLIWIIPRRHLRAYLSIKMVKEIGHACSRWSGAAGGIAGCLGTAPAAFDIGGVVLACEEADDARVL